MSIAELPLLHQLVLVLAALVLFSSFGVFFLRIRGSIDSLDVDRLNRLSETAEDG